MRIATKVRKPRAVRQSNRKSSATILVDSKHVGEETLDWSQVTPENFKMTFYNNLRHYNYFYDIKDGAKWAAAFVKKNRTKDEYDLFAKAKDWKISMTLASICKMISNGLQPDEKLKLWMDQKIDEVLDSVKTEVVETEDSPDTIVQMPQKTPQQIVAEKTEAFIAELETDIDAFPREPDRDWSTYNVYEKLKSIGASQGLVRSAIKYYSPLADELAELINLPTAAKRTDSQQQLAEGYSHFKGPLLKAYVEFITSIVTDLEKYAGVKKIARKPRAKKKPSVERQVSSIKYMKESVGDKLVSVNPSQIVGSKTVYLYNTKHKKLTKLVAGENGFTIRGTTIYNYDETTSFTKGVKKPEQFFTEVLKTTQNRLDKVFNDLKSKVYPATGRINEQTIIFKVYQ